MNRLPVDIQVVREAAARRLPRFVFDFIDGGAGDERALARNRRALDEITLTPRALVDVSQRSLGTTLFGASARMPVVVAPTGLNGLLWPDGDIALARAAARAGVPFVVSTASSNTLESIAERAGGNLAFQLYVLDRELADHLVDRAERAGYRTLVLTVDTPVSGDRRRDRRNGLNLPLRVSPQLLAGTVLRPRWLAAQCRHGFPTLANLEQVAGLQQESRAALLSRRMDASFGWDDFQRLRERWQHSLIIKGVLNPEDARKLESLGADGVMVSNHGGRQLDCAPASISALASILARCTLPAYVDGGFRSGDDIAKGLAVGATAVQIGRPLLYGLAAGGEEGAWQVLELLRADLDRTLALLGCTDIQGLARHGRAPHPESGPAPMPDPAQRSRAHTPGRPVVDRLPLASSHS